MQTLLHLPLSVPPYARHELLGVWLRKRWRTGVELTGLTSARLSVVIKIRGYYMS